MTEHEVATEFDQYKAGFDRDGFVVIPQFMIGNEFTELQDNLDRYICDIVPTLPDSGAFYEDRNRPATLKQMQHMGCDPFFSAYPTHTRSLNLAHALLGEEAPDLPGLPADYECSSPLRSAWSEPVPNQRLAGK